MNRRGFLGSILVACAAPAIVRADSLMRIVPMETLVSVGADDVFKTLTELDAPWLGAVRELCQYEITRDEFIRRWDVMVKMPDGSLAQMGVDLADRNAIGREVALRLLKARCAEEGSTPPLGMLELPMGMHEARFI
jgi:hypothetical protein